MVLATAWNMILGKSLKSHFMAIWEAVFFPEYVANPPNIQWVALSFVIVCRLPS